MRPVNKGANPPYTDKTQFQFAGPNCVAANKFMTPSAGNCTFSITDCLNLWLAKVKSSPLPPGATNADRNKAVSAIKNQVNDLYKLASVPLTSRLGAFCSYCESPMSGLLEVEHCAPKSNYPTFSTSWENFLVCCGPCNNAKGNTPDRATAINWAGGGDPDEDELYDAIREAHYIWADTDDKGYVWMPQQLYYYDGTAWKAVALSGANDTNAFMVSSDLSTRTVIAHIDPLGNGTYGNFPVTAAVTSATGNQPIDFALETINLCNLNGVNDTASTYDRRAMNRTLAWFNCLTSLSLIKQAQSSQAANLLAQAAMMHAVATGFYSVWITLVNAIFPTKVGEFIASLNVANYYPNTNTTDMPT